MKFLLSYSGIVGNENEVTEEFKTKKEADDRAYELACDDYESYAGMNGIRDISEIQEEDDLDYDDAVMTYCEERDSMISYESTKIK